MDLHGILVKIASENERAAERFMDAVDEACLLLAERPELGQKIESEKRGLAGIRHWPVKGFMNYVIFYIPIPGGVEILRVLHGMRDVTTVLLED